MGKLVGIARREKKRAPMETLESAELSEQTGVSHDFRGKPGKRQVTVLSADVCNPARGINGIIWSILLVA